MQKTEEKQGKAFGEKPHILNVHYFTKGFEATSDHEICRQDAFEGAPYTALRLRIFSIQYRRIFQFILR